MESTTIINEPKSRTYMREYKRKKYAEDANKIKEKNKQYYYKNKYGLTSEDMKKYDTALPLVAKIINNLEELKKINPDIIIDVLTPFMNNTIKIV